MQVICRRIDTVNFIHLVLRAYEGIKKYKPFNAELPQPFLTDTMLQEDKYCN
jgi:hypothetical protein